MEDNMRDNFSGSGYGKIRSLINRLFSINRGIPNGNNCYKRPADVLSDAYWICSTDWNEFHYINHAYKVIWGRDFSELYSNPSAWFDTIHTDDCHAVRNAVTESSGQANTFEFPDYRIVTPEGSVKWISTRVLPITDKKGSIQSLSCISTDITRRKNIELELLKYEHEHLEIINSMQDVFYRTDMDGRFILVSPSLKNVFGYQSEREVIGKKIEDAVYFDPSDRDIFLNNLRSTGSVSDYEIKMKKRMVHLSVFQRAVIIIMIQKAGWPEWKV